MYKIILRSKSSEFLVSEGCPEIVDIVTATETEKSKAVLAARIMNEHIRKFHAERKGQEYYFVKKA